MRFADEIEEVIEFAAEEGGQRLDVVLSKVSRRSRSFAAEVIAEGMVEVNGRIASKSLKVRKGDFIRMEVPAEEMPALTPQKIDFGIIYEDENMLVIDKPAGLTVHPAPGQPDGTLVNGLLYHCSIEDSNDLRPGIVHRLDKDTSGLILAAKNRDAREKLASMFMERTVDKRYLAFCWGVPGTDHFIIEQSIGRHPVDRKRMTVREDGRYAKSEIFVKERFKNTFLAEIKIYTGRTHQIRVHMAHAGFPVLDDQVYGGKQNRGFKINRQALHSWKLAFKSPFAHKDFAFTAPLPNDMALLKERLPVQK